MSGDPGELVRKADRELSQHPLFGDSRKILAKVLARYHLGVELFAERLPSLVQASSAIAGLDNAAARRLFFDPLVRLTLEQAFCDLESGALAPPHRLETLLPQAVGALPLGLCQARMPARACVGAEEPKWLWDVAANADPYAQELRVLFDRVFTVDARGGGTLLTPDHTSRARIEDAMALLGMLLPQSGAAALRHVEAIALLTARIEGGTVLSAAGGDLTPSTVFLSLDDLGNPWDIAGCLLHEGLHMKLFDAARSVALASDPAATVQVPWRNVRWSIVRALFAYHVYVHLSLFKAAALLAGRECLDRFGDPQTFVTRPHAMSVATNDTTTRFGRSIDRARHLGDKLQHAWAHLLSVEGRDLVRWLSASLHAVDQQVFQDQPAVPPGDTLRLRRVGRLRTRPVEQAECLMVFAPATAKVQCLDLPAWLIFELSDGCTRAELERAYLQAVGGRVSADEARRQVQSAVEALLQSHLIEHQPTQQKGEAA